ncbi:MAG: type II toxin-antitoxin system RelE/ParE family toxin [Pontibacterium sp.]
MKVYLSRAASHLEDIWHYTYATWGSEQASHYIDGFSGNFTLLAENPLICRKIGEYSPQCKFTILYTTLCFMRLRTLNYR